MVQYGHLTPNRALFSCPVDAQPHLPWSCCLSVWPQIRATTLHPPEAPVALFTVTPSPALTDFLFPFLWVCLSGHCLKRSPFFLLLTCSGPPCSCTTVRVDGLLFRAVYCNPATCHPAWHLLGEDGEMRGREKEGRMKKGEEEGRKEAGREGREQEGRSWVTLSWKERAWGTDRLTGKPESTEAEGGESALQPPQGSIPVPSFSCVPSLSWRLSYFNAQVFPD